MAELTRVQEMKVAVFDILSQQSILNNNIRALDEEKQKLLVELEQARMAEPQGKPPQPEQSA